MGEISIDGYSGKRLGHLFKLYYLETQNSQMTFGIMLRRGEGPNLFEPLQMHNRYYKNGYLLMEV